MEIDSFLCASLYFVETSFNLLSRGQILKDTVEGSSIHTRNIFFSTDLIDQRSYYELCYTVSGFQTNAQSPVSVLQTTQHPQSNGDDRRFGPAERDAGPPETKVHRA
jgi:hypothetical protein